MFIYIYIYIYIYILENKVIKCDVCETCVTCPISLESTVKKDVTCCDVSCYACDMLCCFF